MSNAYVGTFKLGESVPMEFSVQFKTVPATLYAPGTWVAIDLTEGDANGYTYLKLYKGNSAVETTGVDWLDYVTVDFDGLTGQVVLAIATAATDHEGFFAEGQHYRVALKTVKVANALGYADGVTQWVGSFGLRQLKVDIDKINGTAVPNTSGKLWVLDNDGENAGQAAIVANLLDYWAKKGIDVSFLNGAALNSMSAKMVSKNINAAWETHDNTTESLEALRDRVDAIELASSVTIGTPAGDSMSADIAAVAADLVSLLSTALLNTTWTDARAAIIDKITAAMAELTGAADIPATPTPQQAAMLLYQWLRNNSQTTATERRVCNDAGTEVLDATMSHDGTMFQAGKLGDA